MNPRLKGKTDVLHGEQTLKYLDTYPRNPLYKILLIRGSNSKSGKKTLRGFASHFFTF